MQETWKDIVGFEGRYQVSNLGRVKSLERYVSCGYAGRGKRLVKEKILNPGPSKTGHLSVVLQKGHGSYQVHQLVAEAFIGPAPVGEELRHLNGDPTDNRVTNLCYGTRTQNILDVYRQGKRWRKLSLADAVEIKKRITRGEVLTDIAKDYNVAISTISAIKHERTFYWI